MAIARVPILLLALGAGLSADAAAQQPPPTQQQRLLSRNAIVHGVVPKPGRDGQ